MGTSTKDFWDKLPSASAVIASIFIPIVVLLVGNSFTQSTKDSETRLKYVELAVSILRTEPAADSVALRDWAVEILKKQAIVPLSIQAQNELKQRRVPLTAEWIDQDSHAYVYYSNRSATKFPDVGTACGKVIPATSAASK